jgi:UDP-glucuronate 4-epimerase
MTKTILFTGIAGFIGFHTANQLIERGYKVIGIDNLNTYYDVDLKYARLAELGIAKTETESYGREVSSTRYDNLSFYQLKLEDRANLPKLFKKHRIEIVCNLAAQAGVRYSIENPEVYIDTNITGFLNVLQCMREFEVSKIVYASSSSVYGNSDEVPFSKAVEKTFSIGIANDKEWTLALDVDLLLLPNAIEKLIQSGNKCKENLYIYQAYILDWFRGGLKYGGPHLYKTCN